MDDDPFAIDQQALEEKLQALQRNFERWRQIGAQLTDGEGDGNGGGAITPDLLQDELDWLTGELTRGLKSLSWEVNDLQETLTAMQQQQQPQQQQQLNQSSQSESAARRLHGNRALFLGNARALLSAVEVEVTAGQRRAAVAPDAFAVSVAVPAADAAAASATADVELLLDPGSGVPPPVDRRSACPPLLRRHRGPLACLLGILALAFILWVFYEAVLSGRGRQCVCNTTRSAYN